MAPRSKIRLYCTANTGTFARFEPFTDGREIVVRRGDKMGHDYGWKQSERVVVVGGGERLLTRHQAILSPPPLLPGQQPLSPAAAQRYKPEYEVLHLPDAEVLIPRHPEGFSDAEVQQILDAIVIE